MRGIICLTILVSSFAHAQLTYEPDISIPVEVDGRQLSLAWAGGINAGQYGTIDLNGDNEEDLVIFDRSSNKLYTFLREDNQWAYRPEYEALFPQAISNWMLLRDFNCDGAKDLFISDPFGMKAFVNTTEPGELLSWRPYNGGNPILTKGFNSNLNLKINGTDIPAIDDVDGDGDLDILGFRFTGHSTVEYHKNLSMERTGTCDSLQLERISQNWAGFEECSCGEIAFGGNPCPPITGGGRIKHVGGKALTTIDLDNDGDKDILFSEEQCAPIYLMENVGNAEDAVAAGLDLGFPNSQNPISFFVFPAVYYEDVDFDGLKDLIAAPNLGVNQFESINFQASSWFYKNVGSADLPQFQFVKSNFLQDEMIDLGENAAPSMVDVDSDGDLDMVVGSYGNFEQFSGVVTTLRLYENVGNSREPSFKLVDEDYLGLSRFDFKNIKPQFVDFDGDGQKDLMLSISRSQSFFTEVLFVINRGLGRIDFSGQDFNPIANFNLGLNDNVFFYDIDGDGRLDALVGKLNGNIEHYRNVRNADAPGFVLETSAFYGLGPSTFRRAITPYVDDIDADGTDDLVTGEQSGFITYYSNFLDKLDDPEEGTRINLFNSLTSSSSARNIGGKLWPVVADLYRTDKPALVVGTGQGGLQVLKNTVSVVIDGDDFVNLFPNPLIHGLHGTTLQLAPRQSMIFTVVTLTGQQVTSPRFIDADDTYRLDTSNYASGMYIAVFSLNGRTFSRLFIVQQ